MKIDINLEKFKKIPWIIGQKAFWSAVVAIAIAVSLGVGLGYKYVYLTQQVQPETPTLIHVNQDNLEQVESTLEQRKQNFEQTPRLPNLFD